MPAGVEKTPAGGGRRHAPGRRFCGVSSGFPRRFRSAPKCSCV